MEGGNGVSERTELRIRRQANKTGARRAARKNLTRRRGDAEEVREVMEGGNGASETSAVTLCSKRAYQTDEAENLLWM